MNFHLPNDLQLQEIVVELQSISGLKGAELLPIRRNWYPSETTQQIVNTALSLFSADVAALLTPSESGRLVPLALTGESELGEAHLDWLAQVIKDAPEFRSLMVKNVGDFSLSTTGIDIPKEIESLTLIALPPGDDRAIREVLYLGSKQVNHLKFEEKNLMKFAAQASEVLRSALLLNLTESLRDYRAREINPDKILKDLTVWICETTQADIVTLYPYFQDASRFEGTPQVSGDVRAKSKYRPDYFRPDDIASLSSRHKAPVFAVDSGSLYADLGGDRNKRRGNFAEREEISSVAALPLLAEDELFGVLFINFRRRQNFDKTQQKRIIDIAEFAAQTVKRTRERHAVAARRIGELQLLEEIDRELSQTLELRPLLQKIVRLARKYIKVVGDITILLYDPKAETLSTEIANGPNNHLRYKRKFYLKEDKDKSIICWACDNRIPARVGNVGSPEWRSRYLDIAPDTVSELDIPLLNGDALIGAINFESPEENAFSKEHQDFLVTLAGRSVWAIEKARTYGSVKLYGEELSEIRDVGHKYEFSIFMEKHLKKALDITSSNVGAIFLRDPRFNDLFLAAAEGIDDRKFSDRLRVDEDEGVVSWVVKHRESLIANIKEPPWIQVNKPFGAEMGWLMAAPILKTEDEVRGVIAVERPADRAFTVDELNLLKQMADLAEIALRIDEHHEGQRRLKALHDTDVSIISQLDDPDKVMSSILDHALLLTEAEQGDLHLYENGEPCITYFAVKEGKKIVKRDKYVEGVSAQSIERGIVTQVAQMRKSYRTREDAQKDLHFAGDPDIRSEIAVPLLSGDELIGVLNLESKQYDDLDEDDVDLLELLAGQAVIAIQNARNFARAQEESTRFRRLLDVSRDLSEVIDDKQMDKACQLVIKGFEEAHEGLVVIRRYRTETQLLECVAVGGNVKDRPNMPPVSQSDGINGLVVKRWFQGEYDPVVLTDVKNPPPGIVPKLAYDRTRSLGVAPIYFRDQFYGTISLAHIRPNYFVQSDIDLIKGLADRLSITIHRLEEMKARKGAEQRVKESEVMASIGQAASEITHRLGNRLGHLRARLDEIRDELRGVGYLSNSIAEHLENIDQNIGETLKLNINYKDFAAKIRDEENTEQKRRNVLVRELINDVMKGYRELPEKYHLTDDVRDNVAELSIVVQQISDILGHLIINAVEAMPNGGRITVRSMESDQYVKIQVEDDGPGISKATQSRIWSLFYSTKGSSGFGLWSARRYALAHGGDLTVESRLGEGTTFTLLLPKE